MTQLVLANDISAFGKVAISVASPLLAALGIETPLLPTVLLSSHTGGFGRPYKRNLQEDMAGILDHWQSLGLQFDGLLTGYFADAQQLTWFSNHLPKSNLVFVDPVMGDGGRLYSGFRKDYPQAMRQLCQQADVILPNLTEACLLTDKPFPEKVDQAFTEALLADLSQLCSQVVLTGLPAFDGDQIGLAIWDRGKISYVFDQRLDGHFFGTGDMLAALLAGLSLKGYTLVEAAQQVLPFLVACLKDTLALKRPLKEGVAFEGQLYRLTQIKNLGL